MRKQKESKQKKGLNRYLYKPGVLLCMLGFLLSGSMTVQAAVTQEDLANPVVDKKSHIKDGPFLGYSGTHSTSYHYVYFGSYPQREIKGEELTEDIIHASYDKYGNGTVNGRRYKRLTNELTTAYGTYNDVTDRFPKKARDGYRYYLYEPIKWRILKNDGSKLFLASDRAIDNQIYSPDFLDTEWSECELRKWLNYDGGEPEVTMGKGYSYKTPGFMYYAFSEEEKERIQVTTLEPDVDPDNETLDRGEVTQDKIFVPSYTELANLDYGTCGTFRYSCKVSGRYNTDYSRSLNGDDYVDLLPTPFEKMVLTHYWLRTPALDSDKFPTVLSVALWSVSRGKSTNFDTTYVVPALNAGYTLNDCIRVSFETGTDTKLEDQILLGSNFVKEPTEVVVDTQFPWRGDERKLELKRDGYEFTGWYLDKDCKSPYRFDRKITQDVILYAGWKKKQNTPTGLTGGAMKIEGTTSAMEYSSSKEGSAQWTPCSNGITVVPSAGTWYVRYKETKEYSASDAVEVKVITAEEAITKYIREHNIPKKTAAITDKTILGMSSDKDVPGASFKALCARATKVTAKTITLKWNPVKEADGYEIYGNKCGRKNKYRLIKTVPGKKTVSYKQKKLKKGTYYKYIVRAYKKIGGKKVSLAVSKTVHAVTTGGKYGNAKSVNVKTDKKLKKKKSTYTLKIKKNKKYSLKVSLKKPSKKMKSHRKTLYESSNTSIATVTAKGVIKGKKKGSCYIYVYAQNGMYKKIKVNVK